MNEQQNLTVAKKFIEEIYSKGDLKQIEQLCSQDIKLRDPATPNFKSGLSNFKEHENMYKTAFPNKALKIDNIIAAQDWVIVHWTCQGTQKGTFQDHPATNKNFKISGISCLRIASGKICEIDQVWDRYGLLEQLGIVERSNAHAHAR